MNTTISPAHKVIACQLVRAATDKVELKADCRVVGDVKAPRILIADGASFKGNVDMDVKER